MGTEIGIHKNMGGGKEVWCVIVGKDLSEASKSSYTRGYLGVWAKGLGLFFFCVAFTDEFCSGREG